MNIGRDQTPAEVPAWIEQDIDGNQIANIQQGGCESGAYMPAVTYYKALETMSEHGDEVLQHIQDCYGELPKPRDDESWAGMAVHYLSISVELWAGGFEVLEDGEAACLTCEDTFTTSEAYVRGDEFCQDCAIGDDAKEAQS